MLALTLREGEWIDIGDEIAIQYVRTKGHNAIRIGITAPKSVVILRREVSKRAEKKGTKNV